MTARWRPTWEWSAERYRQARAYGTTRIGSTALVSASNLAENALLTRAVGFAQLGLYNRALGLAALACQRSASLLMNALYPVLTRVPVRTPQYRRAATLVVRFVAWTVIPSAILLAWLAEPVTRTLFGSRWLAAVRWCLHHGARCDARARPDKLHVASGASAAAAVFHRRRGAADRHTRIAHRAAAVRPARVHFWAH